MRQPDLTEIVAKAETGARLTQHERRALMVEQGSKTFDRIRDAMAADRRDPERNKPIPYTQGTADSIRPAIGSLISEMMMISMVHVEKREALEDRVADIEVSASAGADHRGMVERLRTLEGSSPSIAAPGAKASRPSSCPI